MNQPFNPELSVEELSLSFPYLKDAKIIKSGGEGTVIKAFSKKRNDFVAIKIFYPNSEIRRTQYQIDKLKGTSLPYVADIYDFSSITLRGQNCYYSESKFIDGIDLRELIKRGYHFSEEEILKMILCIAEAIQNLWHYKIVHCDINPNNIMMTKNSDFYLIDLGLAKHLDQETITKTGCIFGTPGYIAPEQLYGRSNLTLKADFYSLGIVAYELITGLNPFLNNQNLIFKLKEPPRLDESVCKSDSLRNLVNRLTKKQPYLRPLNFQMILKMVKENKKE